MEAFVKKTMKISTVFVIMDGEDEYAKVCRIGFENERKASVAMRLITLRYLRLTLKKDPCRRFLEERRLPTIAKGGESGQLKLLRIRMIQ